jgi:hypothetical protein
MRPVGPVGSIGPGASFVEHAATMAIAMQIAPSFIPFENRMLRMMCDVLVIV